MYIQSSDLDLDLKRLNLSLCSVSCFLQNSIGTNVNLPHRFTQRSSVSSHWINSNTRLERKKTIGGGKPSNALSFIPLFGKYQLLLLFWMFFCESDRIARKFWLMRWLISPICSIYILLSRSWKKVISG